jgi:hypothetical protein
VGTSEVTEPRKPSIYERVILLALGATGKHVYGGLPYEERETHRATRRARKLVTRRSRRANR